VVLLKGMIFLNVAIFISIAGQNPVGTPPALKI